MPAQRQPVDSLWDHGARRHQVVLAHHQAAAEPSNPTERFPGTCRATRKRFRELTTGRVTNMGRCCVLPSSSPFVDGLSPSVGSRHTALTDSCSRQPRPSRSGGHGNCRARSSSLLRRLLALCVFRPGRRVPEPRPAQVVAGVMMGTVGLHSDPQRWLEPEMPVLEFLGTSGRAVAPSRLIAPAPHRW